MEVWWGKKFVLVVILIAAVLPGSALVMSCSSTGDGGEELSSTPQDAGPPGAMSPGLGLSEDLLAGVAEILGIDQQELEDAFAQAQSELVASMPEDRQPPRGMPPGDMPSEDMLPEDMPPEDTSPGDMPPGGMSPGMGLPDDLLAWVAEILGIDQQELADAVEQARGEMVGETAPPSPNQ